MTIPHRLNFTGLALDPLVVLQGKVHRGVVPPEWVRLHITLDSGPDRLAAWLTRHSHGRFAIIAAGPAEPDQYFQDGYIVAFAEATDAVMFRLRGGVAALTDHD